MKIVINMRDRFGTFCADGESAVRMRAEEIDPFMDALEEIVFEFSGVRNMNSSFCNALIAGIAAHSDTSVQKMRFRNCRPGLDVLIRSAVELGVSRRSEEAVR